jgi:hypothetical protein
MARWRLSGPHYLNVKGTAWEYNEIDRITGRPKRTQFPVPLYMNPNYEDDLKSFGQGEGPVERWNIIVSDGNNPGPKDIVFTEKDGSPGLPTPEMEPLDDEARELSAKLSKRLNTPIVEGQSYSAKLEELFIDQMTELKNGMRAAPQAEGMTQFMETMAAMMKQQTEILAMLAAKQPAEGKRRVA